MDPPTTLEEVATNLDRPRGEGLDLSRFFPPRPRYHIPRIQPPLLREGMTARERVQWLIVAYRNVVWEQYKARVLTPYRDLKWHSKYGDAFSMFALHLLDCNVEPVGWCRFSVSAYDATIEKKAKKPKRLYPPVQFIYAKARLAKRHGWYRRRRDKYTECVFRLTSKQRELSRAYEECCQQIARAGSAPEALRIGVEFMRASKSAIAECDAQGKRVQRRLEEQANNGEWCGW